jgi:hypothetical protein
MANLAIKGHPKRGNEVIERLEMLGGINELDLKGTETNLYYYIDSSNNKIYHCLSMHHHNYIVYTLEEFLEKFPYKVGDKVWLHYKNLTIRITETITSMRWCSKDDCVLYDVCTCCNLKECAFIPYKEETIKEIIDKTNKVIFDTQAQSYDIMNDIIKEDMEQIKIDIPEGYEFFGIDDNDKVVFTKIQPKYPKTYVECEKILRCFSSVYVDGYKTELLEVFQKLLICRDAYWKIAGDWKEKRKEKAIHHVLYSTPLGEVVKATIPNCIGNYLLDFPTEEMRDVFYENFKELIEQCKELL